MNQEKFLMLCSWLEDGGGHMAKNVSGLTSQRLGLVDNLTSVLGPGAEKPLSHTVLELISGCWVVCFSALLRHN